MNSYLQSFSTYECHKILKKKLSGTECNVKSYEFRPLPNKMGFLGDHCFLIVNYDEVNQSRYVHFFCKTMCTTESQRLFAIETGAFYKECAIYKDLIPTFLKNGIDLIRDCVPDCYLINEMNYLIFDDLKSKGYVTMPQREPMPLDCVKSSLEALAKLHCSSLIFEEKMKIKTGTPYILSEKYPKLFKETFYTELEMSVRLIEATKKGAKSQIDLFENGWRIDLDRFKQLTCETFDRFREIVKPSMKFRNTICHGDLWSANIMFKFKGDQVVHCKLIDFQSYRYGPPGQDFMGFMYLSTDREFRRLYMRDMMDYFYERMREILNKEGFNIEGIIPRKEFDDSCEYYKLFSIAQTINHFQLIMSSPEVANRLFSEVGALNKVLFEDKSLIVIPGCKMDEIYRRRILEATLDLKDIFIEKGLLKLI